MRAWCFRTKEQGFGGVRHHADPAGGAVCLRGVVLPDEGIRICDVLSVNRTMKKYKICVTIILNFLLVIF